MILLYWTSKENPPCLWMNCLNVSIRGQRKNSSNRSCPSLRSLCRLSYHSPRNAFKVTFICCSAADHCWVKLVLTASRHLGGQHAERKVTRHGVKERDDRTERGKHITQHKQIHQAQVRVSWQGLYCVGTPRVILRTVPLKDQPARILVWLDYCI